MIPIPSDYDSILAIMSLMGRSVRLRDRLIGRIVSVRLRYEDCAVCISDDMRVETTRMRHNLSGGCVMDILVDGDREWYPAAECHLEGEDRE